MTPLKKSITRLNLTIASTHEYNKAKINSIFIDKSNVLWLGIDGLGLLKYNISQERFLHIVSPHPNYKSLNGIWEDMDHNRIWLMSNKVFIACYNRNTGTLTDSMLGATNHFKDKGKIFTDNLLISDGFSVSKNGYWLFPNQSEGKMLSRNCIFFVKKDMQVAKKIETKSLYCFNTKTMADNNGTTWMASNPDPKAHLYFCNENSDTIIKKYEIPYIPSQLNVLQLPFA